MIQPSGLLPYIILNFKTVPCMLSSIGINHQNMQKSSIALESSIDTLRGVAIVPRGLCAKKITWPKFFIYEFLFFPYLFFKGNWNSIYFS